MFTPYLYAVFTITFFCRNRMDQSSGGILPGVVRRKETLSSVDADEGRYSTI
jgi:hypothetical protein